MSESKEHSWADDMLFLYQWSFVISPSKVVHLAFKDSGTTPKTSCGCVVTDRWTICKWWDSENRHFTKMKMCGRCEEWRQSLLKHLTVYGELEL